MSPAPLSPAPKGTPPEDPAQSETQTIEGTSSAAKWLKRAAVALGLVGLIAASRLLPVAEWLETVKGTVADLGVWGPIAYGGIYIVAALAFVPGSLITAAAGAVFGLGLGAAVVSIASTLSAAIAFPLARTLFRSRVQELADSSKSFGAIDRAIEDGGWKIVGLLRLSPVVPFSALNYLLGLTNVRYIPSVLISWVAMFPGTLLYVYFGTLGESLGAGAEKDWKEWTVLGAGLVATLVVTVTLTRMARARMKETAAMDGPAPSS